MDLALPHPSAPDPPVLSGRGAVRRELREALRLAVPVALVQLVGMLMGVVDTMMLGHLSAGALAAGAVGHVASFTILIFASGLISVLDPLVSQAFGAGDHGAISAHFQRGIVLALALGLPFMAAMWNTGPLFRAAGLAPEVAGNVALYMRAAGWGVPAFLLYMTLRQTLQAMSVVRPALIAIIFGNVFNLVANYALIFGHFGAPALGVEGSAFATTISRWVMFLYLLAAARPRLALYWHGFTHEAVDVGKYLRMLRLGLPLGLHQTIEIGLFAVVAVLVGKIGVTQLAGHQISLNLASVSFMLPLGVGGAAATRVGHAIGRADMPGARRSAAICLALGAGVMLFFAALFAAAPRLLAGFYTEDPAVIAMAAVLIPIAAAFQVLDGLQVVAAGVLRGAADTTFPAVIALVGYWIVGLPLGWWMATSLGLGPRGLWWGMTIALFVVALLLLWRVAARLRSHVARVTG
jgi:MATE family multidrug resistance protein